MQSPKQEWRGPEAEACYTSPATPGPVDDDRSGAKLRRVDERTRGSHQNTDRIIRRPHREAGGTDPRNIWWPQEGEKPAESALVNPPTTNLNPLLPYFNAPYLKRLREAVYYAN